VSVNDDVVESDRHAASMRGTPVRVADVVTVLSNLPTKEHLAVKQKQAGQAAQPAGAEDPASSVAA
jgi:hypothetical protein